MTVVKLPIGDGDHPDALAAFEVDERAGTVLLGRQRADKGTPPGSLVEALGGTLPALSVIVAKLQDAVPQSDEITVQLGLRFGGETGFVFVKGHADAAIAVTITCRRPTATATAASSDADPRAGGDRDG